ncbi:MAG: ATP-dependent Clp protease proteolytic subunit, partial [Boseongicola sp. SB0677_bin_26]|nr:ATP-dependent Clp protease proteolytic subunit [Boseongicola sp. SB0677_bin_26]
GQSLKKVEDALERDNFMTPEEAKDWGLIDEIAERRTEPDSGKN